MLEAPENPEARLNEMLLEANAREQFIAVVAHDLRNPLTVMSAGLRALRSAPFDHEDQIVVGRIESQIARMSAIIDDLTDFARGRLGDGLVLRKTIANLKPLIEGLVDEERLNHPLHIIDAEVTVETIVAIDPSRFFQLASNLLSNAFAHGSIDQPVRISAKTTSTHFEFSVSNGGKAIPAAALKNIFQPFKGSSDISHRNNMGLGLYIAYEIARAHGGTIEAFSTDERTMFKFTMPLD